MGKNNTAPLELRGHAVTLVGLLLFLAVLIVYYPATRNQFSNFDDNFYVTANHAVKQGLTAHGIHYAFTTTTGGNWHPLTMLSLELDAQLYGPEPAGFHLTNLLLHALSTSLLFVAFQGMTGCLWKSAWVAAMFALHPLHVESVAWVAERKDVLSGLFWMLTLLAYLWYTRRRSWQRLVCVAAALTLGLMAKVMLVTLPCVLLALDYWPLGRFKRAGFSAPDARQAATDKGAGNSFWPLLAEKMPLFALSALFGVIALWAQHGAHALHTFEERSIPLRLQNAVLGYAVYLLQMVWPVHLTPFYPFRIEGWPAWQVTGALVLLLGVTTLVYRERMRRPFLFVGWFWYVVTLLPVIGLIPLGNQAWADRYTYLPLVGIFLLLAWGSVELRAARYVPRGISLVLGVTSLVACALLSRVQIAYWHDDLVLWQYTLKVNPESDVAHNNLGASLSAQGKVDDAMRHYLMAVAINPKNNMAQVNVAQGLLLQNKQAEAEGRLVEALKVNAENEPAHLLLASLQLRQERYDEAMAHAREALRLRPENAEAQLLLGEVFAASGQWQAAAQHFAEALELARAAGQDAQAKQIEERMKYYERRQSPREAQRNGAHPDDDGRKIKK